MTDTSITLACYGTDLSTRAAALVAEYGKSWNKQHIAVTGLPEITRTANQQLNVECQHLDPAA